jgi:uncharacterized protein (DUF305 family)
MFSAKELAQQIINQLMQEVNKNKQTNKSSEQFRGLEYAYDEQEPESEDESTLIEFLNDCDDLLDMAQNLIHYQANEINELNNYIEFLESKIEAITSIINN